MCREAFPAVKGGFLTRKKSLIFSKRASSSEGGIYWKSPPCTHKIKRLRFLQVLIRFNLKPGEKGNQACAKTKEAKAHEVHGMQF